MEVTVEKVIDRGKLAQTLHTIMDTGIDLLTKDKLTPEDNGKIKVIRTLGSHVNAAVSMVQQEVAQARMVIVVERMKQLGYDGKALNS